MPNYVVDPVNGADPNSGLTESTAWRTPQKARTTARPGDIVRFRGGNYPISDNGACFRTGYHGLAGSSITFQAYPGEIPIFRNQPTGLVFEHNYISIKGFQFLNDAMRAGQFLKGVTAGVNNHLVMEDCIIGNCTPTEPSWGIDWPDVSYGRISRCHIHHVGTPPQPGPESGNGLGVAGHHNLIEDCVVDFCGHAGTFFCGDHNILRRSEFIGTWGVPGENLRHISIPGRNLIEYCIFRNASYLEDGLYSDPSWQQMGSNMLLRFCLIYDGNGAMIQIYSRDDYPSKGCRFIHNVGYHNGFNSPYPPGTYELQKDTAGSQGDNVIKNSIHFKNKRDGASYAGQASAADIAFLSNTWNATDPLFVDEAAKNFRLREGSPCINAGEFLTRTASGGSGRVLSVLDASYFCDGWGIVEGDYIQLEGTDYCTKVLSIDYTNNVLNLEDSLTFSAGQGVSLPFIGTKPDIGAYEYSTTPDFALSANPTLVIVTQGQSGTAQIGATAISGFNTPVTLDVEGLPAYSVATINPHTINPGQVATMTLGASMNTPPGDHSVKVTGEG